ncbi:efflux RND transporter periplasmic adaptor subunit [Roseateles albus]|uniref:Efflux transporter periplasmic adaptor subunit n=1 Tax=Roseateles albus TaxID=2987525 RepID=A0ABT5K860_9BURK|nr:HlyD family efflux transporter periplasmic adaptor subunit [Roseateles albus]MDC8770139.1 efflux transporter periplasmic adaptor subunit [Roseateles albus]
MNANLHSLRPTPPVSGAAMDRALPKNKYAKPLRWAAVAAAVAIAGAALYFSVPRGLSVPMSDLTLATVADGQFLDELVLRAQVVPAHQVLLDATESGRVDEVLVRDGDMLKEGALLYRLSNPQREQEILQRSAEVAQQQANLAMQRTAFANAQAMQRRDVSNLTHELTKAENDLRRQQGLAAQGFVSNAALEDAKLKLAQQQRLLDQAKEDGTAELRTREQAVAEMERAVKGLSEGLAVVRKAASGLSARAPRDGQLSGFTLQVGSSVKPGDRLGRIDDIASFKLSGNVDEFYLSRVQTGLAASLEAGGKTWPLTVSQRLPQVKDGRFGVEMEFAKDMPPGMQAGQSLDARIRLGSPAQARLLADGAFYADSGGAWVYVLSADSKTAERRTVRLGRRAAGRIEVLDGLAAGERVITSKVRQYGDAKLLNLKS